ncbi:hypothetical protein OPV22_019635 [Ensete ventricosum]|uniref:Uncharacterized protein n=1 Tax=Ensete ventricosum TaxID=4639 RepID=A0AAV8QGU4_ENSVE|nr:hypothetical protein OPV22_019635 [Ensete ventricosum]
MALLSYFAMKFFGPKRTVEPSQLISNLFHRGGRIIEKLVGIQLKNANHVEAKDEGPVEGVSYWKPNITINLVDDFTSFSSELLEFGTGRKKISLAYSSMPLLLMRKCCSSSVIAEESPLLVNDVATGDVITANPTSGGWELLLYDMNLICRRAKYSTVLDKNCTVEADENMLIEQPTRRWRSGGRGRKDRNDSVGNSLHYL